MVLVLIFITLTSNTTEMRSCDKKYLHKTSLLTDPEKQSFQIKGGPS